MGLNDPEFVSWLRLILSEVGPANRKETSWLDQLLMAADLLFEEGDLFASHVVRAVAEGQLSGNDVTLSDSSRGILFLNLDKSAWVRPLGHRHTLLNDPDTPAAIRVRASRDQLVQSTRHLRSAKHLTNVRALDFSHVQLREEGMVALADADHLDSVEDLNLSYNGLNGPALQALANWPTLPRLVRLDLSYNSLDRQAINELKKQVLPRCPRLEHLRLNSTKIDSHFFRDLDAINGLTALRHLDLRLNEIGTAGIERLVDLEHIGQWESLDLRYNNLNSQAVTRLFQGRPWKSLITLDLGDNRFGSNAFEELVDLDLSSQMPVLRELRISNIRLDSRSLDHLIGLHLLGQLTHLDLSFNALEIADLRRIAHEMPLDGLKHLRLGGHFDRAGLAIVFKATRWSNLTHLELTFSSTQRRWHQPDQNAPIARLGEATTEEPDPRVLGDALKAAEGLSNLTHLDLSRVHLTSEDIVALANCPHLARLTSLNLSGHTGLSTKALQALSRAPFIEGLQTLNLRGRVTPSEIRSDQKHGAILRRIPFLKI